jgi:DNA/RNA-binding domain of Phe-tRNA-synthetase-like protein
MAYAIPVAVFDRSKIAEYIEVRYATGSEVYSSFSGEMENPEPEEVIFADNSGRAHARRWTNRQSGYSAVDDETSAVLIVAEGVHSVAHEERSKADRYDRRRTQGGLVCHCKGSNSEQALSTI